MMVRAHVYISGRVQGVFFRAETRDNAITLGLTGWVRNLQSGEVEAIFEGEKERVNEVIRWCHEGPRFAEVDNVEVEFEEPTGEFTGFEVGY